MEHFLDCSGLTGSIPNNLFTNCRNVISFYRIFESCSSLTGSIPENLFTNCHNVTDFRSTFYACSGLTGNTPTGTDGLELWERDGQPGYPSSINGAQCFYYCPKLSNL